MANPIFLSPVDGDDPCGPDMRWDPEFLALNDAFADLETTAATSVVDGEVVADAERGYDEIVDGALALSAKTKDLRVLVLYAEARWHLGGLAAFGEAMEDLAQVQEAWPEREHGVHPRAEDADDDLGERAAALGRLLNRIPTLTATIGWGGQHLGDRDMLACAETLRGVFGVWTARFEEAFGADLPSCADAWQALKKMVGTVVPSEAQEEGGPATVAAPPTDAWDLIDHALARMVEQDHHSPALPLLRLLSSWRSLGIIDIVDGMKGSGVTLEQLMESVKRQTQ
jgi:hypothetical protein